MLRHMDGFDQFQGQAGNALLTSLSSFGYSPAPGMAMAAGRHPNTWALELQVTAGSAGQSWSSRPNNLPQTPLGVTHTGVRWVAVGQSGSVAVSDDTQNWLPIVTGIAGNLTAVATGNGRVIAVGPAGIIAVSPDGQNSWQQVPLVRAGITLTDVAFDNGIFIMVGYEGTQGVIFRTTDGETIEQVAQNIPQRMNCVAFGGGRWMAGGNAGVLRVSTDATGNSWETRSLSTASAVTTIAHGESGVWLAGQGRTVYRSIDNGSNWVITAQDLAPVNQAIRRIRYSSGVWVVITSVNRIFTSEDILAETFTTRLTGASNATLNDVAFSRGATGGWVAVGRIATGPWITVSTSPPTTLGRSITVTADKISIGFAHRATARGKILSIANLLEMNWPRGIEILGQESAAVPIRNVWHYYELVIDKALKQVRLYVNNQLDLTIPLPVAGETMTQFDILWIAENGAIARIDDIMLIDSLATPQSPLVDRVGPAQVPLLTVSEDVLTQFEVVPSGIPHHQAVGALPPSPSTFIRSSTSGAKDLFRSDSTLPDGAGTAEVPIFAVGVMALARKSDLDDRQLGLVVGEGDEAVEVIDDELSTTDEYSLGIFERGPAGAAWNSENIDGFAFGVAVRP